MKYASVCSGVEAASLAWLPLGWEAAWFSEIEKFPCEVLKYRFPNVPNLGDMTKIKVEDTEDGQLFTNGDGAAVAVPGGVDLLVGGTPCFAAGEMVLTDKGYVPIERINVGDMVVSHKGRLCPVTATGHKADRTSELKVVGRPMIHCTGNHPFYTVPVRRDCRRKSGTYSSLIPDGEYRFTPASESEGMYAGRLPVLEKSCVPVRPEGMTDMEIVLAGWYVGDGYIRRFTGKNKKAVIIAAVSNDKVQKFRRLFQDKISFSVSEDGKITINCTRLAELFSNEFGELSHNKRIPFWVYGDKERELFLSGYTATDGCLGDNGNLRYSTVSPSLAYGVADILQNASVSFMVTDDTHVIEGRTVYQRDVFEVEKYKKAKKTKLIGDRYASRIKEFRAGSAGIVFNITVGEDHSYIVNGLAVHNCQGFSVAGKQGGLKDERSGLAMCYVNLLRAMHPTWFVWENVPGVFSTAGGEDIRAFLRAIDDIGYSLSWRVLDGQYCRVDGFPGAVPQRRRRVFAVGHLGADWRYSASVLLEPDCMPRNNPPIRKTRQAITGNIGRCIAETGRAFQQNTRDEVRFINEDGRIAGALGADIGAKQQNYIQDTDAVFSKTTRPHNENEIPIFKQTGVANTLNTFDSGEKRANELVVESSVIRMRAGKPGGGKGALVSDECSLTLASVNDQTLIKRAYSVGNGQLAEASIMLEECSQTLNCMHDAGAVLQIGTPSGEDVSTPLDASYYKGAGSRAGEERMVVCDLRKNDIVLDDQGGKNINIHHDISPTLRAETHNHLPNVMCYAMQENGGENISPTITGDHASRPTDLCPVLVTQKVFSLDAKSSNSMKSSNPHSGCHESDVAKTLDTNPPAPECNQGGQVVVAPVDLRDAMRDPEKMDTGLNRQGTGVGDIDAPANTLSCGPVPGVIQCLAAGFCGRQGSLAGGIGYEEEVSPTLRSCVTSDVMHQSSVRRLTPLECERLMGFPDYWTMIPVKLYKSKPTSSRFEKYRDLFFETEDGGWVEMAPDGPRYKACGNSMCVNVMRWIGMRIELTERKMNGEVK